MDIEIKKSKNPVKYDEALKLMEIKLIDIDKNNSNDFIWVLQHPDTYTAGTSYKETEIIAESAPLSVDSFKRLACGSS